MPFALLRFQKAGQLHFVTFSCYCRKKKLGSAGARTLFDRSLEQTRRAYGFGVIGYVVMPEHVHLLAGEPETTLFPGLFRR
jgi:REP-associated tyrosine transposase